MRAQYERPMHIPMGDVHVVACFYAAAVLTVVSAGLVVASVVLGWPGMPANFCIGIMLLAWLGAFERRRYVVDRQRQDEREIREIERYLFGY